MFLETILDHCEEKGAALPISVLDEIDAAYLFGVSKNSEIRFRWQTLCLRSDDTKIFPQVRNFVISQGRMKFVRPLYRALRNSTSGKVLAVTTFEEFKDTYHPIARKMIASDLAKANETDPISSTEQLQAEVESIVSDRSGDTRRKSMRRKHSFTHRYESDIVSSEDSIHFEKHLNISEDAQQNVAKPNSDQTMRKPSSAASTKNNESGTSPLVFLAFGTSAAMMVLHYLSEKK